MSPIKASSTQNPNMPVVQKKSAEQKQKQVETASKNVDSGPADTPEDIVTLSTARAPSNRHESTVPSIPVSHAEMKALYRAFSIKI